MGNMHCCSAESGVAPAVSPQLVASAEAAGPADANVGVQQLQHESPRRPPGVELPADDDPGTPGTDDEPLFTDPTHGRALDDEPLFEPSGVSTAPAPSRTAARPPARKSHAG